jgi:hypothetical protein
MLSQRRMTALITLFAWQGAALAARRHGRLGHRPAPPVLLRGAHLALKVIVHALDCTASSPLDVSGTSSR